MQDLPIGLLEDMYEFCKEYPSRLDDFQDLIERNRIFVARMTDIGTISAEEALNLSFT